MNDARISTDNVLRRAGLRRDLFTSGRKTITVAECFALWKGAATCSSDLNVAAKRLAQHKKLIGPMRLSVVQSETETVLKIIWLPDVTPPWSLSTTELVFWVTLARLCTRAPIRPLRVTSPDPPDESEAYRDYFGVAVTNGPAWAVAFSAQDATRPFLTANDRMWSFFEPELRRRLRDEGTTFQGVLNETRESLALHYLVESDLPAGEIAFLLGYEDTRSFYRAFRAWTGTTPELARSVPG